jgi:hypothetical protein
VTDAQLYLAIGVPVVINLLFNGMVIGIMWQHLAGDIRELRGDLKTVVAKLFDLDNRLARVEDKLEIKP